MPASLQGITSHHLLQFGIRFCASLLTLAPWLNRSSTVKPSYVDHHQRSVSTRSGSSWEKNGAVPARWLSCQLMSRISAHFRAASVDCFGLLSEIGSSHGKDIRPTAEANGNCCWHDWPSGSCGKPNPLQGAVALPHFTQRFPLVDGNHRKSLWNNGEFKQWIVEINTKGKPSIHGDVTIHKWGC